LPLCHLTVVVLIRRPSVHLLREAREAVLPLLLSQHRSDLFPQRSTVLTRRPSKSVPEHRIYFDGC